MCSLSFPYQLLQCGGLHCFQLGASCRNVPVDEWRKREAGRGVTKVLNSASVLLVLAPAVDVNYNGNAYLVETACYLARRPVRFALRSTLRAFIVQCCMACRVCYSATFNKDILENSGLNGKEGVRERDRDMLT